VTLYLGGAAAIHYRIGYKPAKLNTGRLVTKMRLNVVLERSFHTLQPRRKSCVKPGGRKIWKR